MNAVDALLDGLREAVRDSGRAQILIARDLGISEKHLSMFMLGRSDLSLKLLRRMCEMFDLTS